MNKVNMADTNAMIDMLSPLKSNPTYQEFTAPNKKVVDDEPECVPVDVHEYEPELCQLSGKGGITRGMK